MATPSLNALEAAAAPPPLMPQTSEPDLTKPSANNLTMKDLERTASVNIGEPPADLLAITDPKEKKKKIAQWKKQERCAHKQISYNTSVHGCTGALPRGAATNHLSWAVSCLCVLVYCSDESCALYRSGT